MRLTKYLFIISALYLFSSIVSANLIINGSFEHNDVKDKSWRWFLSSDVNGWSGSNIEIWDSLQKFESFSGEQHAELNAHGRNNGAFSIYQSFNTIVDAEYSLSFAYAARRANDVFKAEVLSSQGQIIESFVFDDHNVKQWSFFNTNFSAESDLTTLRFTSLNAGTYGNFLDAISVETSSISEPSTIGLAIALATSVFFIRRKSKLS